MYKVILDPGHGGRDPGAVREGVKEKDCNLAMAIACRDALRRSGVNAVLTRETDKDFVPPDQPWDEDLDLENRVAVANRIGGDCFVSIHQNAVANPEAHGTGTYYYPASAKGKVLAQAIQAAVVASLGTYNRGVIPANFYVLHRTTMPAALVEVVFLSNPAEREWLKDPAFRRQAGEAIAKGICKYLGVSWVEPKPEPSKEKKFFPPDPGGSGSGGGTVPDWVREQEDALKELAEVAKFNTPHKIDETVTLGLLAVILQRMGALELFKSSRKGG